MSSVPFQRPDRVPVPASANAAALAPLRRCVAGHLHRRFTAVLLSVLMAGGVQAACGGLTLLADAYPPYNYPQPAPVDAGLKPVPPVSAAVGAPVGLMAASLQRWLQLAGLPDCQLQFQPWSRVIRGAQARANMVVFLLTRSPDREALFHWLGPVLSVETRLWSRQQAAADDDVRRYRYAVKRDARDHRDLRAAGVPEAQIHAATTDLEAVQMLLLGRVDRVSLSAQELAWYCAQLGVNPAQFRDVGHLRAAEVLYIGISIDTDPAWREQLQNAAKTLFDEGVWPIHD